MLSTTHVVPNMLESVGSATGGGGGGCGLGCWVNWKTGSDSERMEEV